MPDIFISSKQKKTNQPNGLESNIPKPPSNIPIRNSKTPISNPKSDEIKGKRSDQAVRIREELNALLRQKKAHFFSAFVTKPAGFRFENQDKQEEVLLLLRRHPITNISWIITAIILTIVPFFVDIFGPIDFLPARFHLILALVWYLFVFAFTFEKSLTWFFNVNIITDERIIDVDFPSILYKHISETKIDQVQDVSFRVGGFTRSLLNFGDVLIQTAGTIPEICFEAVPDPQQVAKILDQLKIEEEQEKIDGRVR